MSQAGAWIASGTSPLQDHDNGQKPDVLTGKSLQLTQHWQSALIHFFGYGLSDKLFRNFNEKKKFLTIYTTIQSTRRRTN